MLRVLAICLVACFAVATATLGVDVSQATSESAFRCLKSDGYDFAVVRVYQSTGHHDPNGAQSIINARNAGIAYVDGYIFPCPKCGNPEGQVNDTIEHLHAEGAKFGMLWLDIEGASYWHTSTSENVNFIEGMVSALNAHGINWGVYSGKYQWDPITGGWTGCSSRPVWYAHYDGKASYSDWSSLSFGGWAKPNIKQFEGDKSACGVGIDKDWYP
jgi:hypothetical protein